jgi:dihydroorotate dehydrogenase electron transfer subunit
MIWLPGVGEFPMSLSLPSNRGYASIGVKAMGEGSKKLYECKKLDLIGVRGPYGNAFEISSKMKKVLLVGGGTGMVPMLVLARELSKKKINTKLVIGARTKLELPFLSISKKLLGKENVYPTTDDGSFGFKGFATEQAQALMEERNFDQIYSCGPEKMMHSLYLLAIESKIPIQFSLERIMKCGIGICGSCTIGDIVLCKDGPVLNNTTLASIGEEFGSYHRDKSGILEAI